MTKEESLLFYLGTFLLSAILLVISRRCIKNKIIKNIMTIASLLIPIIIAGIRYGIGTDYYSYTDIFRHINSNKLTFFELLKKYEPFHIILCKLIGLFGGDRQIVFGVYAILTILFTYKAIQGQKENIPLFYPMLMYLVIFFPYSYNGMRESLAVSILFYAYTFLKKEKLSPLKASVLNIFALTVHYASFIALPFILLWTFLKKSKRREIIIIGIYLAIVVVIYLIAIFMPENIEQSSIFYKFLRYLKNKEEIDIGIGLIAIRVPIILILILFAKKMKKVNPDMKLYFTMYIISIILMYLGYINITLNRFANYFTIIEVILIATFIQIPSKARHAKHKINYSILAKIGLIFYIVFQFTYTFYYSNTGELFPYRTVWNKKG